MTLDDHSDEELAMIVASGQPSAQEAFALLYGRNAIALRSLVCARLASNARSKLDDICQDTWLRAWDRAATFRRQVKYRAWLFTIAKHLIIDNARAVQRRPTHESGDALDWQPDSSPHPDTNLINEDRRDALLDCYQRLNEQEVQVLRLRLQGYSSQEISDMSGLDIATVYKRMHTGMQKLVPCMEAKEV